MSPEDFLRAVWAGTGPYCLAYTFHPKADRTKTAYKHVVVDDVAAALRYADQEKNARDLYFAMFSLRERQVWDDNKHNFKTGEKGAYAVRTHANMHATRCFFFDIDVGPTKDYASQEDALKALVNYVHVTKLPYPTLVSSGGGLHVYWVFDKPLTTDEWVPTAAKLKQLAEHHGLKLDTSRTTDVSSVLRIPGTFNHKDPTNPRPVRILKEGPVTPRGDLVRIIDDAVVEAGVLVKQPPKSSVVSLFGASNLERAYDGPPVDVTDVMQTCNQLRHILSTRGDVTEPTWVHAIIGTTLFMQTDRLDGEQLAHAFSSGHPQYDRDATQAKIDYRRQNANAPTTCAKIADVSPLGDAGCEGCPFRNDPGTPNPLVATRKGVTAPPPLMQQFVGNVQVTTVIPDAPAPYSRLKVGGVARRAKNADGDEVTDIIYDCDLYPLRRIVNAASGIEQQIWCVDLPRSGAKEFTIDAHALYDTRKFTETIAHQGIYPSKSHIPYLQDYMVAYISQLQKEADADIQATHLGWTDEYRQFILPERVLCEDGSVKAAQLSGHAKTSSEHVGESGDLAKQVELLRFYSHPAYVANQFFVLCSLASPLFYATGHHGVIVNASGVAGSSKSTTLYTAASLWGHPELYAINGTNQGATAKGRNERVTTYANLPVCVDEITHLPVKDAIDLAMGITQPGHRIRLNSDGTERRGGSSYKATMMLATANSSLHSLLSSDNTAGTAGSMRVLEIAFRLARVHQKPEADEYLRQLKTNYGHIGPQFIAFVMKNRTAVEKRIHQVMREIDEAGNVQASERFWSAAIAVVLVAGEIAKALGLLTFDVGLIRKFCLEQLLPAARNVVSAEYTTPVGMLSDYLESIHSSILRVVPQPGVPTVNGNFPVFAQNAVHGPLLAHFDMHNKYMFVLKKSFKDYCVKIGASAHGVLSDLTSYRQGGRANRIVVDPRARRTLGAGTDYAKSQSYCFVVDMKHPDLVSEIDMEKIVSGSPSLTVVGGTEHE